MIHATVSCSSYSRHYQFFTTPPMNKLVFSLPECSQVVTCTFSILSSWENFPTVSVVSIRARTEPAQGRSGKPRFALNLYTRTHACEGQELTSLFRTMASTHFEPTSARMAFPCFDEPSFKANFSVSLRRTSEHISLSNMPMVSLVRRLLAACAQMYVLGGKNTTLHYLWISGQDSWNSEWPVWGPVWYKRKDEHVPGSFCHLWLQICHRDDVFWRAGLPPNISPSCDMTSLVHWHACVNRGVSAGVHLRQCWEAAADRLRPGSRSQNDGFLWKILWYSLSSTKARYSSILPCLSRPHSISSSLTCLSQIWSPSLTSRLAPWRTGVWPPTGRRAFWLIRTRPAFPI